MARRLRALAVGMGFAVLATSLVSLWVLAVFDRLPEQVATHWGITGPDGFAPRSSVWESLRLSLALTLVLGLVFVFTMPANGRSANVSAGITAGLGTFFGLLFGGTVALQASFGADHPLLLHIWWLAPALLLALGVGILAGRVVGTAPPRPPATGIPPRSARMPERDHRRSWQSKVDLHPAVWLILLVPLAIFVIIGVGVGSWILPVVMTAVVAAPLAGVWRWHVIVDAKGLTCRNFLGWPTLHHALAEIEIAESIDFVGAFTYGGPGLRITRKGERLVLRGGQALRVELSDGTDFIVTVQEADVAAKLLNTLIADQRVAVPGAAR